MMPPNGSKILLDWGLEAETKAKAAPMAGFSFYKCALRSFAYSALGLTHACGQIMQEMRRNRIF